MVGAASGVAASRCGRFGGAAGRFGGAAAAAAAGFAVAGGAAAGFVLLLNKGKRIGERYILRAHV